MTQEQIQKTDEFAQHWDAFIAASPPRLFTESDKALSYAFYLKGWLDATKPFVEHMQSELAELGV